jgi:hypothetical protein
LGLAVGTRAEFKPGVRKAWGSSWMAVAGGGGEDDSGLVLGYGARAGEDGKRRKGILCFLERMLGLGLVLGIKVLY